MLTVHIGGSVDIVFELEDVIVVIDVLENDELTNDDKVENVVNVTPVDSVYVIGGANG